MVTVTFPHQRSDVLSDLLSKFRAALQSWRETRKYKDTKEAHGYVGHIRALEVTHGANGWHPHSHELWFIDRSTFSDAFIARLQSILFREWKKAAKKAGFPAPSKEHGLKVSRTFSAADYVSKFGTDQKWGAQRELTKAHLKTGKASSRTPWDLLETAADVPSDASLFREYALAFYGARQLVWSRGLKQAFGLQELTDEEIAELQVEDAGLATRITPAQ